MAKTQVNCRLSDETLRAIRWWIKEDSGPGQVVSQATIVEQAVAVYDEMRTGGGLSPKGTGSPEMFAAIEDLGRWWGCDPAEAMERAISRVHAAARAGRIAVAGVVAPTSAESPPTLDRPVEIAGIQVGASSLPKNAFCKHCGKKFAGARYATRCADCETAGHQVDPHGCDECIGRGGPA